MRAVCTVAALCVALIATKSAGASPAWEKRLVKKIKEVEKDVKELDAKDAIRDVTIDKRILALDARVAALEKAREMKVVHASVQGKNGLADLSTRSAAIVQIAGRVRRIEKHDHPPEVTPTEKAAPKSPERESPPPKSAVDEEEVEWPEELQIAATASLDYQEFGEWLYGSTRRSRLLYYQYYHVGYAGNIHFAARLKGLPEQVKSVDFTIFVVGRTGPFQIKKPVRYDIEWRAKHRHMWNGAVRNWHHYDQWTQRVGGVWIRGPRNRNVKPRVEAYATRVVTDKGRVVTFELPKKYRPR